MISGKVATIFLVASCVATSATTAVSAPLAERFLTSGRLADGQRELAVYLKDHPDDEQARFGLGAIQFLHTLEQVTQALHRYGLSDRQSIFATLGIPFLRLPIAENAEPKEVRYKDTRAILKQLLANLTEADATLAKVTDPDVKLPLQFSLIRLDLDGDGQARNDEVLWQLYKSVSPGAAATQGWDALVVAFDLGDVHWLRAYTRLLMGTTEVALAYDAEELFNRTAHLYFARPVTPYKFLIDKRSGRGLDYKVIIDWISFVHLLNFPLKEPERMTAALGHFEEMVRQYREMWKAVLAETDDDREWIPNSKQQTVVRGIQIQQRDVQRWETVLGEMDAVLAGKKLVPFWRGDPMSLNSQGVNVRRFFTEPRRFDFVMWLQGTGAAPYLEQGEPTNPGNWLIFTRIGRWFR